MSTKKSRGPKGQPSPKSTRSKPRRASTAVWAVVDTRVDSGGMFRCCIDTLVNLQPYRKFKDGTVISCRHEKRGNKNLILAGGTWKANLR